MSDLSLASDLSLIDAEEGLHILAKSGVTETITKAHALVAAEMRTRGLIYSPLSKAFPPESKDKPGTKAPPFGAKKPAGPSDPNAGSDEDEETPGKAGANTKEDNTMSKSDEWVLLKHEDGTEIITKRDYTAAQRREAANSGHAMSDGSFPIHNESDLHNAIRLVGQGSNPEAAKAHIIERAKAMGMTAALPDDWESEEPKKPGAAQPATKKPSAGARLGKALGGMFGNSFNVEEFVATLEENTSEPDEYAYTVRKSSDEKRYTLGPVYLPNTLDAHNEWASPEDLQDSMHEYVRKSSATRTIYLQHTDKPAGEWVEIVTWPEAWSTSLTKSIDGVEKAVETTFPAGTVYMGVIWQDWAWEDVKKGKLTGFSMGGMARRVEAEIQ